jgi:hypothetical protein
MLKAAETGNPCGLFFIGPVCDLKTTNSKNFSGKAVASGLEIILV